MTCLETSMRRRTSSSARAKRNFATAIPLEQEPEIQESERKRREMLASGTDATILTILEESDRLSLAEIENKLRTLGFTCNFFEVLGALGRLAQKERVMGICERTGTMRYVARASIYD